MTQFSSAVLAATMSPQVHPEGFRISDRPVAASFAHPYSFQVVDQMHRDEACLVSSPALGGIEGGWVRYWDESSTLAMLEFEVEDSPQPEVVVAKKEKKRVKDGEIRKLEEPVKASALPLSDKPVTLNFSKNYATKPLTALPVKTIALGFSLNDETAELSSDTEDQENSEDKRKVSPNK
jgi:RNA-binding protein 5/10